jgi:hypothetical protein
LLRRIARIAEHSFCLSGRGYGSRGCILNYSFCLTRRCGGHSRGVTDSLADCLSGLRHARLQVSHLVRRGIVHHLAPFGILLPRERLSWDFRSVFRQRRAALRPEITNDCRAASDRASAAER